MSADAYLRYLKGTYDKASAAWRREMRKNPLPCHVCGNHDAEITPEEVWLCREHKAQLKALQPYKSYAQRLTDMKIPFLSKEDFEAGKVKPKKKRKLPDPQIQGMTWNYTAGRGAVTKRAPAKRKK